jgi:hypothetical protein
LGSGTIAPRILWPLHKMEVSGQLHAPAALHPGKKPLHWIGSWVGLTAGLDMVTKRNVPSPRRESNPDRPAPTQSLYLLSYPGSPGLYELKIIPIFVWIFSWSLNPSYRLSYDIYFWHPEYYLIHAGIAQWVTDNDLDGWDFISGIRRYISLRHHIQNGSGAQRPTHRVPENSFPGEKADGVWSWPLASTWCRGQECAELYFHSPLPTISSWRGA